MKRTNTAKWIESAGRWQINVQKDGVRKTFTSAKPGRTGQREANKKADEWLDIGVKTERIKVSDAWEQLLQQKQLGVEEKKFISFLMEKKYIYRDKKAKLMPYADKNNGLFEVKECFNEKTKWSGTQTLITPKGREMFRLLCLNAL